MYCIYYFKFMYVFLFKLCVLFLNSCILFNSCSEFMYLLFLNTCTHMTIKLFLRFYLLLFQDMSFASHFKT